MFFERRIGSRRFHNLPLGTKVVINGEIGQISGHNTDPKKPRSRKNRLTTVLFTNNRVRIENITDVNPPKKDGVKVTRFRDKFHRLRSYPL